MVTLFASRVPVRVGSASLEWLLVRWYSGSMLARKSAISRRTMALRRT